MHFQSGSSYSTATDGNRISRREANVGLSILTAIFALNILDRQIIAIVAEPIKQEFQLSDTQVGLLTGLSFALVYMISGVFVARLADIGNRAKIISICVCFWSAMTACCGVAANFVQLIIARMGVAFGEAGCAPASFSLLADYYRPDRRAFAIAVMQAGAVVGSGIALFAGGMLAESHGWRAPLVVIGVAGLLLGAAAYFVIPEARVQAGQLGSRPRRRFADALRSIVFHPPFRWLMLAGGAAGFGTFSLQAWMPIFYQRVFGWSVGFTGSTLALVVTASGIVGALAIGRVADRRARVDAGAHCAVPAMLMLGAAPFLLMVLLADDPVLSVGSLVIVYLLTSGWQPGVFAAVQYLMDDQQRATASSLLGLVVNLLGLGMGPLIVGSLSDGFTPANGDDALRYALLPVALAFACAAIALAAAARSIRSHALADGARPS